MVTSSRAVGARSRLIVPCRSAHGAPERHGADVTVLLVRVRSQPAPLTPDSSPAASFPRDPWIPRPPPRPAPARRCAWCRRVCIALSWLLVPGRRAPHTMWMPRSCTWNMNAASTPYDPGQAGRMSVSAARREPKSQRPHQQINIRQLTDVLQCKLHQYLRQLTSSSAPPSRGAARPDRRTKDPDDYDGAAPTGRTARVPRPPDRGTGRGGRGPPPGPGRHQGLAGPRRPGRRPPAHQRAGDQCRQA